MTKGFVSCAVKCEGSKPARCFLLSPSWPSSLACTVFRVTPLPVHAKPIHSLSPRLSQPSSPAAFFLPRFYAFLWRRCRQLFQLSLGNRQLRFECRPSALHRRKLARFAKPL